MGTRSTIALEFADGTVKQVYCHWDGYLSNNGRILQESYMDPFKVKELVERGAMSSLSEVVDGCSFYAEDRGEELTVNDYKNSDEYFDCSQQEEYDYILRNINGVAVWFVRCYATNGQWVTMAEAHEMEALEREEEDY
jgi:hypothetical protein